MKRICIYGKGGIGKSTVVANLAAALAEGGHRVAVVGCDPKADSTRNLTGHSIPTVLERMRTPGANISVSGYRDILCIESGGPEPGTGCAGRGIVAALNAIREERLLVDRDVVLFDVLGDVVCGGFSMPMREQVADAVYLVTTCDYMALYAANNICRGIARYAQSGDIRLAGVILNGRSGIYTPALVEEFAARLGTSIVGRFGMSTDITRAELERKTVIERYPDSEVSESFRALARAVLENEARSIPTPMSNEEVEALCRKHLP